MPRAPDLPLEANLAYMVNYFLSGCGYPPYIFFDFVKEPALDLALLYLEPDLQDIVQGMVDPGSKRGKKKGRKGRPKSKSKGIPDISDLIGDYIGGKLGTGNLLNFGAGRFAFKLLNIYERITWTLAVVDGFSDLAFANLWALTQIDPDYCREFPQYHRYSTDLQSNTSSPDLFEQSILSGQDVVNQFFTTPVGARINSTHSSHVFQAAVQAWTLGNGIEIAACLRNETTNENKVGGSTYLDAGEWGHVSVSATIDPGDTVVWGYITSGGIFMEGDRDCTGFGDLPPPPSWL